MLCLSISNATRLIHGCGTPLAYCSMYHNGDVGIFVFAILFSQPYRSNGINALLQCSPPLGEVGGQHGLPFPALAGTFVWTVGIVSTMLVSDSRNTWAVHGSGGTEHHAADWVLVLMPLRGRAQARSKRAAILLHAVFICTFRVCEPSLKLVSQPCPAYFHFAAVRCCPRPNREVHLPHSILKAVSVSQDRMRQPVVPGPELRDDRAIGPNRDATYCMDQSFRKRLLAFITLRWSL